MPRGRPAFVTPNLKKHISLPEDLVARLELELFSEVEGKIPLGAQQRFFERLLREYFQREDDIAKRIANAKGMHPAQAVIN